MQLMTTAIEKTLPKLKSQDGADDPVVHVKYFSPYSGWTWWATEGERNEAGDLEFFGLVDGFESEWGYFTLSELENAKRGALPLVERDLYFQPKPLSEAKRNR